MKWRLEEIARNEEKRSKRVWVGYGKMKIDGDWWSWDEGKEVLRDGRGKVWKGGWEEREGPKRKGAD